jgi:hypothetical protein
MDGRTHRTSVAGLQTTAADVRLKNEAELQPTLELLQETYNQHHPHQSLIGHMPDEAWRILEKRRTKAKRPKRR